jgi:hypothetical protein
VGGAPFGRKLDCNFIARAVPVLKDNFSDGNVDGSTTFPSEKLFIFIGTAIWKTFASL